MGVDSRCSCKGSLKKLEMISIPWEYAFSLLIFVIKDFDNFLANTAVHGVNIRNKRHLHRPAVTLSCIKRGVLFQH